MVLIIMAYTIKRIRNIFRLIRDENTIGYGRMSENDFTRNSPLNFVNLLLLLLNSHRMTNYIEIRNFFKKIKENPR